MMADVLCGEEDAEGKAVEEVAGGQQTGHRTNCKARRVYKFAGESEN